MHSSVEQFNNNIYISMTYLCAWRTFSFCFPGLPLRHCHQTYPATTPTLALCCCHHTICGRLPPIYGVGEKMDSLSRKMYLSARFQKIIKFQFLKTNVLSDFEFYRLENKGLWRLCKFVLFLPWFLKVCNVFQRYSKPCKRFSRFQSLLNQTSSGGWW